MHRVLYLPIFEPGHFHDVALAQKRGLHDALAARYPVCEWDYLANDSETRFDGIVNRIETFQPTLVLTQLHAADVFTAEQMRDLRTRYPHIVWVNWSGDSWLHSLTSPAILELARAFDLWLVAAPDVLPVYEREGVRAAFWQIAYEPPVVPLPDVPTYDVVFLGNVISDKRRALLEMLRTLDGVNVGIYGDWERADGHNTYSFAEGEALYKNATLAIADCAYVDQSNYISNRPFQCLAAGGALLLHQHVPRMDRLSGLVAGRHYIEWQAFDDLRYKITDWLSNQVDNDVDVPGSRRYVVERGQRFVLANHTYEARVDQLMKELLPIALREAEKT